MEIKNKLCYIDKRRCYIKLIEFLSGGEAYVYMEKRIRDWN
jgi:hypothetical protein